MFKNWALKVFFSLAALGPCATLVACCCCDFPITAKLPAGVERGTVAGTNFVAVTQTGKVIKVDLFTGSVTDLGTPATKLSSFIDATPTKALVASPGKAHLISLANGKVERCVSFTGETILGLGLIGNDKAFVYTGLAVVFLDLSAGKVVNVLEVGPANKAIAWGGAETRKCQRVGQRLYVANGADRGLSVIDLDKGKVLEQVPVPASRRGTTHVVGDKALVLESRRSYGVFIDSLSEVDLKTKKHTARKFSGTAGLSCSMLTAPNGTLYLVNDKQALRYEDSGKLTPVLSPKEPGRLVGFWMNSAIVVNGNQLRTVEMPRGWVIGRARK